MPTASTTNEMPAKDVNDFRFHRLEKENQYTDLQVYLFVKLDHLFICLLIFDSLLV